MKKYDIKCNKRLNKESVPRKSLVMVLIISHHHKMLHAIDNLVSP